jgi:hypothetical protein
MRILRPEEVVSMKDLAWEATPEQVKEALRLARESFTAADLQEFKEIWDGVPMEDLLADMEKQQQDHEEGKRDATGG